MDLGLKSLDSNFDDCKRGMMNERGTKNYCYYSIATNMLLHLKNEFSGIWHVSVGGRAGPVPEKVVTHYFTKSSQ